MNKTVITVLVIIAAAVLVALTMSKKPAETPAPEAIAPITEPAAPGMSLGEKAMQDAGQASEPVPYTGPVAPAGTESAADVAASVVEGIQTPGEAAAPAVAPVEPAPAAPAAGQ